MKTLSRRDLMKSTGSGLLAAGLLPGAARAATGPAEYRLRAQTNKSETSTQGRMYGRLVELCRTLSGGRLQIDLHYSNAIVEGVQTFDAAASGVLDIDMTGASYLTGKDPAFQFIGDVMGGYEDPIQFHAWLDTPQAREIVDPLYARYGMYCVGLLCPPLESLSSTVPIPGIEALKGWKFRSPPGMESEIFASLGAAPVVMPFGEVFTAMETGVVSGADAGTLALNRSLGLYEICKYATYPGFHSMPADHLAINLEVWNRLPESLQFVIRTAQRAIAFDLIKSVTVADRQVVSDLGDEVTFSDWSDEDRKAFRQAALDIWKDWATRSPAADAMVTSHLAFMKKLGLLT
ncbi:TRAP transporter substrate-binding protein DctP [Salinicola endophyticus]|uniref:TRAP transporter substrate-binding protein DctP n=1 Tax=Salinicola endophyticus TaxID=1949083 RepID=A0AB74UBY4_9GAMM